MKRTSSLTLFALLALCVARDAVALDTPMAYDAALQTRCPARVGNWTDCARFAEGELLRDASLARRDGASLTIQTHNGPSRFTDDTAEGRIARYSLVRVYPGTPYVLVGVGLAEGTSHILLNRRSGQRTQVEGDALLSPDRERFAVWSADEAYDGARLQSWRIRAQGLELELETDLNGKYPANVHWDSRGRLCHQRAKLPFLQPELRVRCQSFGVAGP